MRRLTETGSRATSIPSICATPVVGNTRVVRMPIVVVLPAPFGPSKPKNSPRGTSKEMPSSTSCNRSLPAATLIALASIKSINERASNSRTSSSERLSRRVSSLWRLFSMRVSQSKKRSIWLRMVCETSCCCGCVICLRVKTTCWQRLSWTSCWAVLLESIGTASVSSGS